MAQRQRGREGGGSSRVLPVMVNMLVCVIHAEGLVDGSALAHEGDGAARIGRDVTDCQQPVGGRWLFLFEMNFSDFWMVPLSATTIITSCFLVQGDLLTCGAAAESPLPRPATCWAAASASGHQAGGVAEESGDPSRSR